MEFCVAVGYDVCVSTIADSGVRGNARKYGKGRICSKVCNRMANCSRIIASGLVTCAVNDRDLNVALGPL